jgi:hypothetical protein
MRKNFRAGYHHDATKSHNGSLKGALQRGCNACLVNVFEQFTNDSMLSAPTRSLGGVAQLTPSLSPQTALNCPDGARISTRRGSDWRRSSGLQAVTVCGVSNGGSTPVSSKRGKPPEIQVWKDVKCVSDEHRAECKDYMRM